MTTALPAPSELEAARVLLARLGITPDLLVRASAPATMPTFDDYIARVEQAVSDCARRAYRGYWQRIRVAWGPCQKAATGSCVAPPVQAVDDLHRRPRR